MYKVYAKQSFNAPVSQLFDFLSKHENLDVIFAPVKSKLLKEGATSRYGAGSVRKMNGPFGSFEETITISELNQRIEYKITNGSPLKNHLGTMLFSGDDKHSALNYTIVFESKLPFIGFIVQVALQRQVRKGLAKIATSNLI